MTPKPRALTSGDAARLLGISTKALRLYEQHGLVSPGRTRSGWRSYARHDIERAADVAGWRKLGLGLAAIGEILAADPARREIILDRHRVRLEKERDRLDTAISAIRSAGCQKADRGFRSDCKPATPLLSFDLPWPWDGERFDLASLPRLAFITGPLGSGKTRLATCLAVSLPRGRYVGLDRLAVKPSTTAPRPRRSKSSVAAQCQRILRKMAASGTSVSNALAVLVEAIYFADGPIVVDMVEQDLDAITQEEFMALLRHTPPVFPLFLMTRSSAILDISKMESGEAIIYCPANHSPPMIVTPDPSCPGYEAVALCVSPPQVRERSAGMVAAWQAGVRAPGNDSRETIC